MATEVKCCFCFSSRTGALIVGYSCLLYVIGEIIHQIVNYATFEVPEDELDPDIDARTLTVFFYMVFGMTLFISVLFLGFNIALLVGLHQNKSKHVQVFIRFLIFIIVISLLGILSTMSSMDFDILTMNLFFVMVLTYFVTVLKNYHTKMIEDEGAAASV